MIFWMLHLAGFGDTITKIGEDLSNSSGSVDEVEAIDVARIITYIRVRG
jgi:hypothetical protein